MRKFLEFQRPNLFFWTPLLMASGGALFFSLFNEPHIICPMLFALLCLVCAFIKRTPIILRAVLIFMFGFLYSNAFSNLIDTPVLSHTLRHSQITGTIYNLDYDFDKTRIYLHTDDMNVRLTLDTTDMPLTPGDKISGTATMFRPSLPDAPNTFDYARWSYFNGLSANGFISDIKVIQPATHKSINSIRTKIHFLSNSFLTDGLVLGFRNSVSKSDIDIWMSTGIGHIWSISGFHMTLVSSLLFALFYCIFRLVAPITRRTTARVPAIICSWLGLLVYLFISGASIATLRAFTMLSLIFIAFLSGRKVISLRNVCLAFCIIFLINPHYVLQAGFQLSFSAIFGLVWFWHIVKPPIPKNKILRILYTAGATCIVATIFTAPFIISHFNSLPIYSLLGNLILLPVFSFAIMPLVLIGSITCLFGYTYPTHLAHMIYDYIFPLAEHISNLPNANMPMPYISNTSMMLIIIGFACMIFIRPTRAYINYILFALFISAGICTTVFAPHPVFFATHDHELVGFVEKDKISFNRKHDSNHYFAFRTWKNLIHERTDTENIRRKPEKGVWFFKSKNFDLAYIQKFESLQKNIQNLCDSPSPDYIVSYFDIDAPHCNHKILRGGFVIYESGKIKYTPTNRRWHNPR